MSIPRSKQFWVIRFPDGSLKRHDRIRSAPGLYLTEKIANGIARSVWCGGVQGTGKAEAVTLTAMGPIT